MGDDIGDLGAAAEVASRRAQTDIRETAAAAERLGLAEALASASAEHPAALETDLRAVLRGVLARRTLLAAEEILRGPDE